jgi:ribosomal protein S10
VEAKLTWTELWKRYKKKMVSFEWRVMSFSRWTQYVKLHQPGVRLTRMVEDVCNSCVRINIQLTRDNLLPKKREHLVLEKGMHLQATIDQRRFMSGFVKQYIAANAPQQPVPYAIIPNTIDDAPPDPIDDAFFEIQIQIEDFSGSFPLPFYGHQRPSVDYFNSNLMMQNFIISDITAYRNNVLIYDERG